MTHLRAFLTFSSLLPRGPRFQCFISNMSTIYALSSGKGKCGVAVIRVSGSQAALAVQRIGDLQMLPPPRQALLRRFKDPESGEELDRGLLLWFPGPRSFSGEDSCEFQVHGGPAVIAAMLRALGSLEGYRPAEPGEFTRRAFHAGKLELTEVEGLADLVHAETEAQRKQALLQAGGSLAQLYARWRQDIIKCTSELEAFIDFSEDQDLEPGLLNKVDAAVQSLAADIKEHLSSARCGERLRDGVRTAIVGEPNVGKSSLLNALCGRPAAIVSALPGTTRDVVEAHVSVGGYPVVICDTAGLRHRPADTVEAEGMSRARREAELADIVVLVVDGTQLAASPCLSALVKRLGLAERLLAPPPPSGREAGDDVGDVVDVANSADSEGSSLQGGNANLRWEEAHTPSNCSPGTTVSLGEAVNDGVRLLKDNLLVVVNKVDLVEDACALRRVLRGGGVGCTPLLVSCRTQQGLPAFVTQFTSLLKHMCGEPSRESPAPSQARHRHHLTACVARLHRCRPAQPPGADMALAAHELRAALHHLAAIAGHVSTEQILDVIFRDFCIGK